jgi:NhaP-type Na+/H+ or K+/H+ antiporter
MGGVFREINKKTKFPYTPMVVVFGIILGHWDKTLGVIGKSTVILSHINPHMILFVFIPVLIFESGFNCDWYVFKRAIVNILTLAAPGVLWGSILLGFCLKVILRYDTVEDDVSWNGAFMMGAVMSATDPVAVVALLKELGAPIQ